MNTVTMQSFFDQPQERIDQAAKVLLVLSLFWMPISTAATNVFMGLTLIAWLLSGGFRARCAALCGNWFAYATVALFAMMCVGSLWSTGSRDDILYQLHKYAKLLFMLPAITLMQDSKWRRHGLMAFGAAMLLTLALSLASVIWPLPFVRGTAGGPSDNHFVFRDHIAQNLIMSFFALVLLVKGYYATIRGKKLALISLGLLSIVDILFLVHGRTGYVSLALNTLVFIVFMGTLRQRIVVVLISSLIAITAFMFSANFNSRLDQAMTEYKEQDEKKLSSIGQRVEFIKKGAQLIQERPVLGFGTGSYQKEFCRVADTREWCSAGGFHPHNQFIAFGVQLGMVGILAYLMYLSIAVWQALKLDNGSKILGVGIVATLLADSIFHAPLFLVAEASFFILLLPLFMAIGTGSSHTEQRQAVA